MHGEPFVVDMLAPMPDGPLISYAQNHEDVVLWRALGHVHGGRYVEVGANEPLRHSVSRTFYERGWCGLTVEPVPTYVEAHRRERPRDIQAQVAVTSADVDEITLHLIPDSGLSTLVDDVSARHEEAGFAHEDVTVEARRLDALLESTGWEPRDIHFLLVDVEGAEADVLASIDLTHWRPWVLVIESTAPLSTTPTHDVWEPAILEAGYEFCLFDGISRFYVASERADALRSKLSYPACALDDYTPYTLVEAESNYARELGDKSNQVSDVSRQLVHWRNQALVQWAEAQARQPAVDESARQELEAMRRTLSWRVTRPLRLVRRLAARKGS